MKLSNTVSKLAKPLVMIALVVLIVLLNQRRIDIWLHQLSWSFNKPTSYSYHIRAGCLWEVSSNLEGIVDYRVVDGEACAIDELQSSSTPDVEWLFAAAYRWCTPNWEACEISYDPKYDFPIEIATQSRFISVSQFSPCAETESC